VGTSVKRDGVLANPVDAERVRRLVDAARGARR
jgi:predicted TIM-barrel enzyme